MAAADPRLRAFLATLPAHAPPTTLAPAPFIPTHGAIFVEVPFAVNYVARVVQTVAYTHPDSAALAILSRSTCTSAVCVSVCVCVGGCICVWGGVGRLGGWVGGGKKRYFLKSDYV